MLHVDGKNKFLLKVVPSDWQAYQDFLTSKLLATTNVNYVKFSLSVRIAKIEAGVPVKLKPSEGTVTVENYFSAETRLKS